MLYALALVPVIYLLWRITMKQSELAAELLAARDQVEKFKREIVAHVTNLEAQIQAIGNVAPAVEEALTTLKTALQGVDDLHPDVPPMEPVA